MLAAVNGISNTQSRRIAFGEMDIGSTHSERRVGNYIFQERNSYFVGSAEAYKQRIISKILSISSRTKDAIFEQTQAELLSENMKEAKKLYPWTEEPTPGLIKQDEMLRKKLKKLEKLEQPRTGILNSIKTLLKKIF